MIIYVVETEGEGTWQMYDVHWPVFARREDAEKKCAELNASERAWERDWYVTEREVV